jgi:hypothetical protein
MPVFSVELLEGAAGLGVHQVEERADAEIAFQIRTLGGGEGVILVPCQQVLDAGDVGAAEADVEKCLGGGDWEVVLLGVNEPGEDRRVVAGVRKMVVGGRRMKRSSRLPSR